MRYGHPPNVKYFKIFGSKCYILKDDRHGKFDAKSDEGIFLGYSTRSKAYKCLNVNTNKVVESANVNFDEFVEDYGEESGKESENYRSFVYFHDGLPNQEDTMNQTPNQQQISISAESQIMNARTQVGTESHLGAELLTQAEAELQNGEGVHSDSEVSAYGRNVETYE